jgi:hypothetical protein
MRKGLLCSLAFLVGAALAQSGPVRAQQPSYYYPSWPSASPGAVQGYGYYQAPSGNSGYNYQYPSGYSYPNPNYQNAYQYQNASQNWYPQGQRPYANGAYPNGAYPSAAYPNAAYTNGAYPNGAYPGTYTAAPSSVTANRVAPTAPPSVLIHEGEGQTLDPNQPLLSTPPLGFGQLPGFADLGPDPAELARPPRSAVESIARCSVKDDCFWVWGDYIMAWTKHMPTPPLVTTGFGGSFTSPGVLGDPTTQVLFGGHPLAFGNPASGFRGEAGLWLDQDNHFSLDFGGFFLPKSFNRFALQSDANGNPVITRPIFDPALGAETVIINADPGAPNPPLFVQPVASGGVNIAASQSLWGLDANARYHWFLGRYLHAEGLMGIRYARLVEDLSIKDNTTPFPGATFDFLGNPVPAGTLITDFDYFRTSNQFVGFQLGGRLRWDFARYFIDVTGKAAVGANQESVMINGATSVAGIGTAVGGVLALPSNIGNHNRTQVSFLPEVGIGAGVNLTRWCRLHAGYNFMYWNNVVRAGDQIDRVVSSNQLPTAPGFGTTASTPRPLFSFNESNFWVQYINLGVEFHY